MNQSTSHEWKHSRQGLKKVFHFSGISQSIRFVNRVVYVADRKINHHPDIELRFNLVTLHLLTHDAGNRVTEKDWELAHAIDAVYKNINT